MNAVVDFNDFLLPRLAQVLRDKLLLVKVHSRQYLHNQMQYDHGF
jgi:hypothetical protein